MKPRDVSSALPPAGSSDGSKNHTERLAHWLIQCAAHKGPPSLEDRLEEEWLADLASQRRGLSQLRFAIGCCWATRVIAHEHLVQGLSTARSAMGSGMVSALADSDPSHFSRRMTIFLFIVGLHVIVIYAFAIGLGHTLIHALPEPMKMTVLSPPITHDSPPPVPNPNLGVAKLVPPRIQQTFQFPDETTTDTGSNSEPLPDPPATAFPPNGVNRVLGGPGAGFPNTGDYYPQTSRRLGETGVTTVRVCVDGDGRLSADPVVAQSSGSPRLDSGAVALAKAGSGHYRSTTENGRPVPYCYPFRIRFEFTK
jgi:TonB family protein